MWNDLVKLFVDQFIFNTMIDVTLRDLETTKQGLRETFFEYMTRLKGKVSKIVNRPNEKNKINMIIKNFLLAYNSSVRTYVFHLLRTYVMILCNWLIL